MPRVRLCRLCRRSAKIATRKNKADAAKAKLFGKIGKQIAQAVRQGGPDQVANARLREALAAAKVAQVGGTLPSSSRQLVLPALLQPAGTHQTPDQYSPRQLEAWSRSQLLLTPLVGPTARLKVS